MAKDTVEIQISRDELIGLLADAMADAADWPSPRPTGLAIILARKIADRIIKEKS